MKQILKKVLRAQLGALLLLSANEYRINASSDGNSQQQIGIVIELPTGGYQARSYITDNRKFFYSASEAYAFLTQQSAQSTYTPPASKPFSTSPSYTTYDVYDAPKKTITETQKKNY